MDGVNSTDVTIDESFENAGDTQVMTADPLDHIRTTYDMVAERYAKELAGEMLARPIERGMYLSFAELARSVGKGPIGDIGCGPGLIAKHLASHGLEMTGIDISPTMIALARQHFPEGDFRVGSMHQLPFPTNAWAGAVSIWATLHSDAEARGATFAELGRCVRRDGYLLHSFFISAPDQPPGSVYKMEKWFDYQVSLPTYFVDVATTRAELKKAGFVVQASLIREPLVSTELPARRCYLFAQRK